jgi:hypothetical protein
MGAAHPSRRGGRGLKFCRQSPDVEGVDPISAPTLEQFVAVVSRGEQDAKALTAAMIKLIETSAAVGREALPPDATFHTYA